MGTEILGGFENFMLELCETLQLTILSPSCL